MNEEIRTGVGKRGKCVCEDRSPLLHACVGLTRRKESLWSCVVAVPLLAVEWAEVSVHRNTPGPCFFKNFDEKEVSSCPASSQSGLAGSARQAFSG